MFPPISSASLVMELRGWGATGGSSGNGPAETLLGARRLGQASDVSKCSSENRRPIDMRSCFPAPNCFCIETEHGTAQVSGTSVDMSMGDS